MITQNINIMLLFLIVLASAGLVAATIYFSVNFESLNVHYEAKKAEYDSLIGSLERQNMTLQKIESELKQKASREEEIAGKYGEVKSESEKAKAQLADLTREKETLEGRVGDLARDNDKLNAQVAQKIQELAISTKRATDLNNNVITLTNIRTSLESQLRACQAGQSKMKPIKVAL